MAQPVELDKRLGGLVASLRKHGEFAADPLETILGAHSAQGLNSCKGAPPRRARGRGGFVFEAHGGCGPGVPTRGGASGFREWPLLPSFAVEARNLARGKWRRPLSVGCFLAYDTEKRLQKERLANEFMLDEWNVEAGPKYFDETVSGVKKAIEQADKAIKDRGTAPYRRPNSPGDFVSRISDHQRSSLLALH